jgi:hypothetical protein
MDPAALYTLYVVPMVGNKPLDGPTEKVMSVFADCGFSNVAHGGPVDALHVTEGVRRANASSVLLSTGGQDEVKAMAKALVDTVDYVIAVGRVPTEDREGDRSQPFFIHPDEGEERIVWLASFIRNGLSQGSP